MYYSINPLHTVNVILLNCVSMRDPPSREIILFCITFLTLPYHFDICISFISICGPCCAIFCMDMISLKQFSLFAIFFDTYSVDGHVMHTILTRPCSLLCSDIIDIIFVDQSSYFQFQIPPFTFIHVGFCSQLN